MERTFIKTPSPHFFDNLSAQKIMIYVIIALLPASIASVYFFGLKALNIILASVISAVLTESIIKKLAKKPNTISDGSAIVTGMLLALVLPPTVPLWIPIVGSAFAISIAKLVFGGLGYNIFNPALAGRAFLVLTWPALMSSWIWPDGTTGATPLTIAKIQGYDSLLKIFITKVTLYKELYIGNVAGTIGETSALALLVGAVFLFYKKVITWQTPLTYLGSVFILTFIFRQDPIFHILAGGLLLGAFFMATDYVTSPLTSKGKIIFGLGCGIFTTLLRLFSNLPEGVMYSILIMNAFTPLIDRYTKKKQFGK